MFSKRMVLVVVLIILVSASILVLALSSRGPFATAGPGRVAITLVAPFQKVILHSVRFLREIWDHYFFHVSLSEHNDDLRQEVVKARALEYQYQEVVQENQRLRGLLDLRKAMDQPMIAAVVISKDPSPWFQTILVDKGSDEGIARGMPVITPAGVVGLVVDVTGHYAKVMLITDPNSAVDAVVQNSRARGIIKGGTSGVCVFDFVLRKHNIYISEAVVTSGMDGVFPKGLPVGAVTDIVKNESGIFQGVTVTPFVDFERLEEVLIVQTSTPADSDPSDPS
jgi:rod shape-determining protein MreC